MQPQAKGFDVTLNGVVADQVPAIVSLDAENIAWVVTALVGNSLRYVHHGSRVMPGGSIAVRASYDAASSELIIDVQDDGPGIAAVKLPLLLSVRRDQVRVGLGLSMVREVVAAHAGHIEVRSDTDTSRHGTTVRLTLPVW
jgi:signal transduction histidine kinase